MLAEHLLAGDLWRHTGKVGLRRTSGGFGQPEMLVNGNRHRIRIDGTALVVLDGDTERWHELTSAADAATFAGSELGAPLEVFTPETELAAERPLMLDAEAAAMLAEWFALVEAALEEMRRRHRDREPTLVQLWPEHFDLAFSMSEINFGGSPGDTAHDEPYLYVGPWSPVDGPPWNEPWGMSIPTAAVGDASDAIEFFESGLRAVDLGGGLDSLDLHSGTHRPDPSRG